MSDPVFAPALGTPPVLAAVAPDDLHIDAAYQRALDGGSGVLIARIAAEWNWDLCQPLNVARRADGRLFVIDGQHRLAAARRRGDIASLPCVVVDLASTRDEAERFVALNGQRRALSPVELFRGQVAAGAKPESAIARAMAKAGLTLAPHTNFRNWKPGMVSNVAGLRKVWANRGPVISGQAMTLLARAWPGEVIRYAGTFYEGLATLCAARDVAALLADPAQGAGTLGELAAVLGKRDQASWYGAVCRMRFESDLAGHVAAAQVFGNAWRGRHAGQRALAEAAPTARPVIAASNYDLVQQGKAQFCNQCDRLRTGEQARACSWNICGLRGQGAAGGRG